MKTIRFHAVFLGKPKSKQRPRFVRRGRFSKAITPKETLEYETYVKEVFVRECQPERLLEGPLHANITAHYLKPKSTSKKKRQQMLDGLIRPTKKPDLDNICKIILDALNQIAYADDSQVVEIVLTKYYSEQPRVELEIWEIGP